MFDDYNFVIWLEIRKCDASSFSFLGLLWLLGVFYGSIWILGFFFSVSVKHAIRILIKTVLDLQITLNNMEILLLSLPLREHGYFSIYLCLLQLHSSRASLLSSPFLYLISFPADSTNPPSSYLAFFEPIPCPAVRHHFLCTIVHIEEIICLCTHPKTKSFLWTVPCQIYLGCMNVMLD